MIGSSITQATDYLVVGDKPGAKLTKAKAMGVTVLSENEFFGLVNGDSDGD